MKVQVRPGLSYVPNHCRSKYDYLQMMSYYKEAASLVGHLDSTKLYDVIRKTLDTNHVTYKRIATVTINTGMQDLEIAIENILEIIK